MKLIKSYFNTQSMFTILDTVAQLFARRSRKTVVLFLPIYLMSVNPAVADFIVEDKFWGLECKYYFACKRVFVDGVDTGEGINPLTAKFPVSYIREYNEKFSVCHIKVDGGLFSWLAGFVKKQNLYSKQKEESFKCVKE